MKIRKQFQKQADELMVTAAVAAAALLEPPAGDKKAALFSTEACTSPHEEAGGGAPTLQQLQEDESNSGSCGDWTLHGPGPDDLHNNVRRKYARRSLRSAGLNGYSNGKLAVVAQVIQRRSTPRGSGGKAGHPSEEPEGSLLHCLYLQLLAAGSEGMTLKEIFASFASQTRFSSLGSNWREQVKSYLTSSPAFKGVKARYFLSQEIDQKSESASPDPSEGVQTRRKTYERTIEAVLNESVAEFQKASQKVEDDVDDDDEEELSTASMTSSEDVPPTPPRKRKSSSPVVEIQEPMDFRHTGAVPGSLKAMQARIVAETGGLLQSGARCSRKDGSNHHSKWQCPMMAMEGKSLCQHHNFLSERKKARYKRAKRIAAGKPSSPPPRPQKPPQIIQDLNKPPRDESPPPPPPPPVTQRVPRTRSDAQSLAESANMTIDMDSETEVLKSRSVNPTTIPEPAGRQSFRSTRKPRLYLAAKKTAEKTPVVAAAPGKSMKKQSVPLIRPPSIPPLPMLYGVRRKSMKNRPPSQLSL